MTEFSKNLQKAINEGYIQQINHRVKKFDPLLIHLNKNIELLENINFRKFMADQELFFKKIDSASLFCPIILPIVVKKSNLNNMLRSPKIIVDYAFNLDYTRGHQCGNFMSFLMVSPVDYNYDKYNLFQLNVYYNSGHKNKCNIALYQVLNGDLSLYSLVSRIDLGNHDNARKAHIHLPNSNELVQEMKKVRRDSQLLDLIKHSSAHSIVSHSIKDEDLTISPLIAFAIRKFNILNLNLNDNALTIDLFQGMPISDLEKIINNRKFEAFCDERLNDNIYHHGLSQSSDIDLLERCVDKCKNSEFAQTNLKLNFVYGL